jgi:integrase
VSLYKRGGIWWYKFKFQGQSIRESSTSGSRTIAREAEHARRRELETAVNRIRRRDPMPLFRVAAQGWLAEKVGLSQKTVLGYQQRTAPLREEFGDRLVCDLTRDDVLSYRAKRLAAKKSPRTVNYEICCLRGILDGYGLWGAVSRKLSHLKENHNVGQAISADDENKLLIACNQSLSPSLFPLFILAIDTGLRASELRALRCKDLTITWSAGPIGCGELVVPKSKTEAGKGRSIPLTQRGCAILSNWLARFPAATADHYVFPRHSVRMVSGGKESIICAVVPGEQVQSWQRAWRKVLKDADLKYRWHDLRHTFVTRLAENPNISEETIRALAGHVSKEMLQRYSHIRVAAKRDAIAALERDRLHNSPAGGTELGTIREHSSNEPQQVAERIWLPPRDSNPDMLIQSQLSCR